MTTRSLLITTILLTLVAPGSIWAAQVTATDLVKDKSEQEVVEPMQEFKGPVELLNAAKRGDTAAQLEVAILYEYGFNMADNEVYALAWYLLAADGSSKAAAHRDKLINKLAPAQIDRARNLSKSLAASITPDTNRPTGADTSAQPTETPGPDPLPPAEIQPMPQNQ
jgi:TPR repeat protein